MKTCADCGQAKPLEQFYSHPDGRQARMHICKDCHKAQVRLRRRTNPAVQEYDRKRAKTAKRKAHIKKVSTQWREDHPEAYRAQTAVGNALRDGRLKRQPCSMCGATKHVHGHHRDYNRPLDVTWLCAKCHHRLHALFPELRAHREVHP